MERELLLITRRVLALRRPSLQASTMACMFVPPCDDMKTEPKLLHDYCPVIGGPISCRRWTASVLIRPLRGSSKATASPKSERASANRPMSR